MLPVISDFKEVAAVVREYLNTYCQIDLEKIVSVLAVRGADLSKPISATELNSINLSDTFVVYEIREDDSQDYFVFDEDDFTDTIITNVIIDFKIYGKRCADTIRNIIVNFKNEGVLQRLYSKGIYYKGITKPTSHNEFFNNTMWPRRDISFKAQIRTLVDKPIPTEYFPTPTETSEDILEIGSSLKVKDF